MLPVVLPEVLLEVQGEEDHPGATVEKVVVVVQEKRRRWWDKWMSNH